MRTADDPSTALWDMVNGYWRTQTVTAAAELGLADHLADGPLDVVGLAERTGAHPPSLNRLLRALAALGLVECRADDRWATTTAGSLLQSDHPSQIGSRALLVSRLFYELWGGLTDAVRTGRPAVEEIKGELWIDHIAARPDVAPVFDRTMVGMSAAAGRAMLECYDVPTTGTLVDVGGGSGGLVVSLLQARPGCSGVVHDLPSVVERTRAHLASHGVGDRCIAVGGDFFTEVPTGGDVYLLSLVLHDWEDADAVTILRRCREAMADGGRVVVLERVIPSGPAATRPDAVLPVLYDMHMLAVTGGRERTEAEYAALFAAAGLRHTATVPTAATHTLLEARAA